MRTCQRTVLARKLAFAEAHRTSHELKLRDFRTDRWHRIGDQCDAGRTFCSKGSTNGNGIDVQTIHDNARDKPGVCESGPHDAGRPASKGRHGVEEMRDACRALCDCPLYIFGSGLTMPDRYPDPVDRKTPNETWRHTFGRKRDEGMASLCETAQPFEVAQLRLKDV